MSTKNIYFIIVTLLFLSCSSSKTKTVKYKNCESKVLIDSKTYITAAKDFVTINNLEINENCLTINFSASGCSGNSWEIKLIDSEDIMESFPIQRNLIFSLKNEERCMAYITKKRSFDISKLKIEGEKKIVLNIKNTNQKIVYNY